MLYPARALLPGSASPVSIGTVDVIISAKILKTFLPASMEAGTPEVRAMEFYQQHDCCGNQERIREDLSICIH